MKTFSSYVIFVLGAMVIMMLFKKFDAGETMLEGFTEGDHVQIMSGDGKYYLRVCDDGETMCATLTGSRADTFRTEVCYGPECFLKKVNGSVYVTSEGTDTSPEKMTMIFSEKDKSAIYIQGSQSKKYLVINDRGEVAFASVTPHRLTYKNV